MSEKKKNVWLLSSLGCVIAGTSCGIPFIPGIRGSRLPGISYPRFVLGSNDSGQELHIPARDLLRKGQTDSIPFSKVNMQWGFRQLGDQDILVSACSEDKKFYVGKHIWDAHYLLNDGKKFSSSSKENCCCHNGTTSGENGNGKAITLTPSFKKKNGGPGETISKIMISLNTCKFSLKKENKEKLDKLGLSMECKGFTSGGAGGGHQTNNKKLLWRSIQANTSPDTYPK